MRDHGEFTRPWGKKKSNNARSHESSQGRQKKNTHAGLECGGLRETNWPIIPANCQHQEWVDAHWNSPALVLMVHQLLKGFVLKRCCNNDLLVHNKRIAAPALHSEEKNLAVACCFFFGCCPAKSTTQLYFLLLTKQSLRAQKKLMHATPPGKGGCPKIKWANSKESPKTKAATNKLSKACNGYYYNSGSIKFN